MTHQPKGHPRKGLVLNLINGQHGKVDQARVSQHFQAAGSFLLVELILIRETAYLRTIQFGTTKVPKLTRATLVNTEVHLFI